MDLQSVMKDKYALAVMEDVSNGDSSAMDIAKRSHLPSPGVDRAIDLLRADGLVDGEVTDIHLTEKGRDLLKEIRKVEHTPSGMADARARSRAPDRFSSEDNRRRKEDQGT